MTFDATLRPASVPPISTSDRLHFKAAAEGRVTVPRPARQSERAVPGIPGLRIATYPSGRRTYIYRFRDPVTGRKTCKTLGPAD